VIDKVPAALIGWSGKNEKFSDRNSAFVTALIFVLGVKAKKAMVIEICISMAIKETGGG